MYAAFCKDCLPDRFYCSKRSFCRLLITLTFSEVKKQKSLISFCLLSVDDTPAKHTRHRSFVIFLVKGELSGQIKRKMLRLFLWTQQNKKEEVMTRAPIRLCAHIHRLTGIHIIIAWLHHMRLFQ